MRHGMVNLNAGTLDDPSVVVPTLEVYCDSALPWVQLAPLALNFVMRPGLNHQSRPDRWEPRRPLEGLAGRSWRYTATRPHGTRGRDKRLRSI